MTRARQALGRLGEQLAARALESRGYALIARNVRTPMGEIDLVARDGDWWVFVEVRCRRGTAYGRPEDSLTARKRAHLLAAAQHYLNARQLTGVPWRVDFVAVAFTPAGALERVEVIPHALGG